MLTAEQLRVNNYVHYNGMNLPISSIKSPKPLKDKRHSDKWIIELFDGASTIDCVINDIKPIKLTEEWLLKMGLKWSEEHKVYYNNGFNIEKIGEMLLERRYGIIIKHVHQVQNFYNIVTNKELTIK